MKYLRPHVHNYADAGNSTHTFHVLLPLEYDYESVSMSTSQAEDTVTATITLGPELSSNEQAIKFGPEQFDFSEMGTLIVEVKDDSGTLVGKFECDDPENHGDAEALHELSPYIYLNQPSGGDYQIHVLVDISEDFRNKNQPDGLEDDGNGEYRIEVEEVTENRNGLPIVGTLSDGSLDSIIEISVDDVTNSRIRGPVKYRRDKRDPRS